MEIHRLKQHESFGGKVEYYSHPSSLIDGDEVLIFPPQDTC